MSAAETEQYREGIRLFNEEEFFECHDVLEELWAETDGPEKKFIQGVIQAAISLFHFGNENFGGAKKLYITARKLLDVHPAETMGISSAIFLSTTNTASANCLPIRKRIPPQSRCRTNSFRKFDGWINEGEQARVRYRRAH